MRTGLAAFLAAGAVLTLGLGSILWVDRIILPHAPSLAILGPGVVLAVCPAWAILYGWLSHLLGVPEN